MWVISETDHLLAYTFASLTCWELCEFEILWTLGYICKYVGYILTMY